MSNQTRPLHVYINAELHPSCSRPLKIQIYLDLRHISDPLRHETKESLEYKEQCSVFRSHVMCAVGQPSEIMKSSCSGRWSWTSCRGLKTLVGLRCDTVKHYSTLGCSCCSRGGYITDHIGRLSADCQKLWDSVLTQRTTQMICGRPQMKLSFP